MKHLFEYSSWLNEASNGRLDTSQLVPVGKTGEEKTGGHKLNAAAAKAYNDMKAAAEKDGISWGITDSYRDYEAQVDVAQRKGLYSQGGLAAKPGTSNHGWGSALDLKLDDAAFNWLKANAAKFGFSNIPRERWHWEYKDGIEFAKSGKEAPAGSKAATITLIDSDLISNLIKKLKEKGFSQEALAKYSENKPIKSEDSSSAIKTAAAGTVIELSQGKLTVNQDKTAPLVIVFGGINVGGKESGEYMPKYLEPALTKASVFIAKNSSINGETAYRDIINTDISPRKKILYLFSGGYLPGKKLLSSVPASNWDKIYLVDIWIGNNEDTISTYETLAKKNPDKVKYYYTGGKESAGGSNNLEAKKEIIGAVAVSKPQSDHMGSNTGAVSDLLTDL